MALPAAAGANADDHLLVAGKADARGFFGERAGDFEITADADAAQFALLPGRLLAHGKTGIVGRDQRALEHRGKIAAVVSIAEGGGVGNFLRRNQIAPAQLSRIDAGLVGGGVDQPLHQIAGLGPPGAAIGPGRQGIAEHAARI